jgi:hypothetical protein
LGSAPDGGSTTSALLAIDRSASVRSSGGGKSDDLMRRRTPGASAFQSAKAAAPVRTCSVWADASEANTSMGTWTSSVEIVGARMGVPPVDVSDGPRGPPRLRWSWAVEGRIQEAGDA